MSTASATARLALVLATISLCHADDFAGKADRLVASYFDKGAFMGTVLVARDGKSIFSKSYGWADAEWDVPNTATTKFRLGSVTKQFTAVAVMQLVERGKMKLDAPVSTYWPEAPQSWSGITVEHLLTHTSGIPSYTGMQDFMLKRTTMPLTAVEIVNLSRDLPLEFTPGSRMKYNNTGYVLLGYLIERVTGSKYIDYLKANLLDPIGMKDTGYDTRFELIKRRASGYSGTVQQLHNARYIDMTLPFSAGALYSTVGDLLLWDQALYGNKLLSAGSKQRMWTPFKAKYGYGWFIDSYAGHKRIGHGGGIFGFNTMMARYPDDKLLVIVLSNLETAATSPMAEGLAKLAFEQSQ